MEQFLANVFFVDDNTFLQHALETFRYQYAHNKVYRTWVDALRINVNKVKTLIQVPFMPIQFFKAHEVVSGALEPEIVFESSGTTGSVSSKHFVKDVSLYRQSFIEGFKRFYGEPNEWCIVGLLPSYLERSGSSLVFMMDELMRLSNNPRSGFYLYDYEKLANLLHEQETWNRQTIVFGLTSALLEFAEAISHAPSTYNNRGNRRHEREKKEMVRDEMHRIFKEQWQLSSVHSEYGMTELLSQAYSFGDGLFKTVPWLKVLVRDSQDPLQVRLSGKGVLNIIDLANIHSCSFIATDDVGYVYEDERFEVLGRSDDSEMRGCGLMLA